MVGLGESEDEIRETIKDLFNAGCKILTIGQYLQPTMNHMQTVSYIAPEKFDEYKMTALNAGFRFVESNPLVRSSFHAEKHIGAG
jgi:lipoic acid synthetase